MKGFVTAAFAVAALTLVGGADAAAELKLHGKGKQGPVAGKAKAVHTTGKPTGRAAGRGDGPNARSVPFGSVPSIRARRTTESPSGVRAGDDKAKARTDIGRVRNSRVSGSVKQTVVVDETANVAVGKDSKAITEIGVVRDSRVSGKVRQRAVVRRNTNVARGTRAQAITKIGVVEASTVTGGVTQTTTVGSSTTIAEGTDVTVESNIGTISNSTISGAVDQTTSVNSNLNLGKE